MRLYNFSAGPAMLPKKVLKEAAQEMLNYRDTGMSVMEMSHRSDTFKRIIEEAETDLREIANIDESYEILFLQGGGSSQFAMVPMNLMKARKADYIITGNWSVKAYEEAQKYGDIKILESSEDRDFSYIPNLENLAIREDTDYVYITENNTIYGTKYKKLPDTGGKILVSDSSSCFLSERIDIKKYGLLFAGAQKNIGPAGLTLVVIKRDILKSKPLDFTPIMFNYGVHAKAKSLYNTPPSYSIYIAGKVFKWIKEIGGLGEIEKRNKKKAKLLYDYLDQSKLFRGRADKEDRSMTNVTFSTSMKNLDEAFLEEARKKGLVNLRGYRTVGGLRASLYNAMPYEGVKKLVEVMEDFERKVK